MIQTPLESHQALESSACTSSRGRGRAGVALSSVLALMALWGLAACDGAGPAVDASTPVSAHTSAVSLRIDVSPGKPPTLSVLAFRAAFSGVGAADVLGMVDPLSAEAPRHDCQLRDVDHAAAVLVTRGDAIELEELAGVGVSVGPVDTFDVLPSPRLYPDLTATIGGVVGEAGPIGLSLVPTEIRVRGGGTDPDVAALGVPETGWIRQINGATPRDGMLIPLGADVNLALTPVEAVETSIEVRPFGATVALSCHVSSETLPEGGQIPFVLSREGLAALMAASGATPGTPVAASLDLVRRSSKQLPVSATRVSLEVRTSTFVELRP